MTPSQNTQILDHLEAGHCLDSMTALRKFGCARLAARVLELREVGYDIRTRLTMVRTRAGRSRVAIYWLPKEETHAGYLRAIEDTVKRLYGR